MTLEEKIEYVQKLVSNYEEVAQKYFFDDKIYFIATQEARKQRELLGWLKALKEIWDSGDCNNCLHQKNCIIRPQLGQLVRFNCYQYERRGE